MNKMVLFLPQFKFYKVELLLSVIILLAELKKSLEVIGLLLFMVKENQLISI